MRQPLTMCGTAPGTVEQAEPAARGRAEGVDDVDRRSAAWPPGRSGCRRTRGRRPSSRRAPGPSTGCSRAPGRTAGSRATSGVAASRTITGTAAPAKIRLRAARTATTVPTATPITNAAAAVCSVAQVARPVGAWAVGDVAPHPRRARHDERRDVGGLDPHVPRGHQHRTDADGGDQISERAAHAAPVARRTGSAWAIAAPYRRTTARRTAPARRTRASPSAALISDAPHSFSGRPLCMRTDQQHAEAARGAVPLAEDRRRRRRPARPACRPSTSDGQLTGSCSARSRRRAAGAERGEHVVEARGAEPRPIDAETKT